MFTRLSVLSVSEVSTLVIAAFTVTYALVSILLWLTTRRTLHLLHRQLNLLESVAKAETLYRITAAHRQIFISLLTDRQLLTALATEAGMAPDPYVMNFIATLLINHAADVFRSFRLGHLEPSEWEGLANDLRDLFSWSFVKRRWEQISEFYALEFREYVRGLLPPA